MSDARNGDAAAASPQPRLVLLVDGTCLFCHRLVAFILRHDGAAAFHFAHLQGPFAQAVLARHRLPADDLDGVYLVAAPGTPSERLFRDGAAGQEIWPRLFWFARPLRWVPAGVLDFFYRALARVRYRLFGRSAACLVPSEEHRDRMLD
jgi:predicted DCC family thiol-disulfide oxidoreductase YuxK